MQKHLSNEEIDSKLKYLHSKLSKKLPRGNKIYSLPKKYKTDVLKSDFSQASLQKISNNISFFLELPNKVIVIIGKESSAYMMSASGIDPKEANRVGLYSVKQGFNREIILTKKFGFEFKNILAILVHENIHNFLHHHGIKEPTEDENEILTDLTTAYLGFGHLVAPGYETINWTETRGSFLGEEEINHRMTIGYLTPDTIRRAIIISIHLRNWDPEEVISKTEFTFFERYKVKKIIKNNKRKEAEINKVENMLNELEDIKVLYDDICKMTKHVIDDHKYLHGLSAKEGNTLVEIINNITVSDIEVEIKDYYEQIIRIKKKGKFNERTIIDKFERKTHILKNKIKSWHNLLKKCMSNA